MCTISNYIGGNICNPISGHYLDNFEPATGKVYSLIPDSDHNDVAVAVEAAQNAFPYWSSLSIETRSVWLSLIHIYTYSLYQLTIQYFRSNSFIFASDIPLCRFREAGRGKSGQRRVPHRLTGGIVFMYGTA